MPQVSVIIPTFNSADTLAEAIESVLAQTSRDYEIIVVDDGSTDGTRAVAERYANCIRYTAQQHRGPSAARNKGLGCASGEYVAFLDADDVFLSRKLELQCAFLDRHSEIDVVYSDGFKWNGDADAERPEPLFSQSGLLCTGLGKPSASLPILAIQNAFPIHVALARRSCIAGIGGFDEGLGGLEDWDLWFRLAQSQSFAFLDGAVAKYRQTRLAVTRDRARQRAAQERLHAKIESSEGFRGLTPPVRARAFFAWGVMDLEYGDAERAYAHFVASARIDPGFLYAHGAVLVTRLLGSKASIIFRMKRRGLGYRRLPGI